MSAWSRPSWRRGYYPTAGGFDVRDGEVEGIFGLVIEKVAERLNLKPVYKAFDFPALIPALQAGRVDVAGSFSITQPRAQVVYLTTPMFLQPEAMAVREGTDVSSWEDAAAKKMTLSTNVGYFQISIWPSPGWEGADDSRWHAQGPVPATGTTWFPVAASHGESTAACTASW
jgi:ABC-type amino acid transport substrate-binding protein